MMQRIPALLAYDNKKAPTEIDEAISFSRSAKGKELLLVGEGNFSFSASIVENSKFHIVATSLQKDSPIDDFTSQNIQFIQECAGEIYTDVDVKTMYLHPEIGRRRFDRIVFNFPHIDGKMNILMNRLLLEDFFKSASRRIKKNGEIHVSLLYGQSGTGVDGSDRSYKDSWKIVTIAAKSNLILHYVRPFIKENYKLYQSTGYRGTVKEFDIRKAHTFIFRAGNPVILPTVKSQNISDSHLNLWSIIHQCFNKTIEDVEERLTKNVNNPLSEMFSALVQHMSVVFEEPLLNKVYVHDTYDFQCEHMCNKHCMFSVRRKTASMFYDVHKIIAASLFRFTMSPNARKAELFFSPVLLPDLTCRKNVSWKPYLLICCTTLRKLLFKLKKALKFVLENHVDMKYIAYINSSYPCTVELDDSSMQSKDPWFSTTALVAKYSDTYIDSYRTFRSVTFQFQTMIGNYDVGDRTLLCGAVGEIELPPNKYAFLTLDVESIAMIKHHVFDERILYSPNAQQIRVAHERRFYKIYRSICLFPTRHELHSSFWVSKHFKENVLLLFVTTYLSHLIEICEPINNYEKDGKLSHCFKFVYCAIDNPLSREKAVEIHNTFTVNLLCNVFHIILR